MGDIYNPTAAGAGGGDVSKSGTPANNQLAVWTNSTTIEGDAALTFDTTDDTLAIAASGKLAFGAVDVLSDSAGTTTLSNIDALDATTEATIEAAIDTLSNLTSIGTIATGVWQGTAIAAAYLGAHATTHQSGGTDAIKLDDLAAPDDNTDLDVSITLHGLTPKAPNDTTQFLRGDATWATPSVGASDSVQKTVFNATGVTLSKGKAVYINGWNVGNGVPTVALAQSDAAATMPALGLVLSDITNNSTGTVVVVGSITAEDTSAYTLDDPLYVDPTTPGDLTTTKPVGANLIQSVARVTRVNVTQGTIFVAGALRSNDIPNFTAADKYWYGGTSGVSTEGDITAAGRAILDDADASAQRTTLGLAIGTDVQAFDAANATASSTTTFTNKTIDANGTGNSISNIDVADLANGTDGELITWDAAGAPATVAAGTATHVLTSNGAGAAPTFQAAAGGGGGNPYDADAVVAASGGDYTTLTSALGTVGNDVTIYIEDGTYAETGGSFSQTGLTIIGQSHAVDLANGSATDMTFTGIDVTIKNLTMSCSSTGKWEFQSASGNSMSNCKVDLASTTNALGFRFENGIVTHSHFTNTTGTQRQFYFNQAKVSNCIFSVDGSDSASWGVILLANDTVMTNSEVTITGGTTAMRDITLDNESSITNCYIGSNASYSRAIHLDNNSIATGNVIENAYYAGEIEGPGDIFSNNVCLTVSDKGIVLIDGATDIVMNGNVITSDASSSTAIQMPGNNDHCIINNNIITGTWTTGVNIGASTCDKNVVVGNVLVDPTTGLSDTGTGTVSGSNAT